LRRRAFALDGRVSAEWSRCPDWTARHAWESVALLPQSSAGWMPAKIGRLSAGVGRRDPLTNNSSRSSLQTSICFFLPVRSYFHCHHAIFLMHQMYRKCSCMHCDGILNPTQADRYEWSRGKFETSHGHCKQLECYNFRQMPPDHLHSWSRL